MVGFYGGEKIWAAPIIHTPRANRGQGKIGRWGSTEDVDAKLPTDLNDEKLIADVEQFLYFHHSADLTAEVLQVRLLPAILKILKSPPRMDT